MVRTAVSAIRISAGKSSKKTGISAPSAPSPGSKAGSSSSKLPPIPYQETPSWQKPITNFFKSDGPLKPKENKNEEDKEKDLNNDADNREAEPSKKKLKLDANDKNGDNEKNTEFEESNDEKNDKTPETNKENALKNTEDLDEGASTSKD